MRLPRIAHLWPAAALVLLISLFGDRLRLAAPSPNHLYFAHTFTTAAERSIIEAAIRDFRRHHPDVRITQIISNSETYNSVGWRLQLKRRRPPDIYFHWRGFKVDYAIEQGWALDLSRYLSRGFLDQFVSGTVAPINGKIFFLPQSIDLSNLVWYNKTVFTRAGLAEPDSLEDWLALCHQLKALDTLPLAQGNRDLWPMGNFAGELLAQELSPSTVEALFTPGTAIEPDHTRPLRTLAQFHQNHFLDHPGLLSPGAVASLHDIDAKVLFLTGQSAQHVVGSWFLADIADALSRSELQFEIGVFPVPAPAGKPDAITAVATGYLVNPATKNPAAAVAFLELLLSRSYQERFAALGNLSARQDAASFTSNPQARELLEILRTTKTITPPPDTGYRPEQALLFYRLCGHLLSGKLALTEIPAQWNAGKARLAKRGL